MSRTRLFQDLKARLCTKKPSPALTELYIEANRNAKTGLEGRFVTACVQEDHYEQAVEVYMPHGADHNEKLDKLYIYSESFTGNESHSMNDLFERKGKRTQETIDVNSEEQTDISEDSTLVLSAPQTVVPQEAPRTVLTHRDAIFGRLGGLLLATIGASQHILTIIMTSQVTTTGGEQADVVSQVTCPYKGAALALKTRAKQIYNTVYVLKQHIHTLRHASNISIKGHKVARTHLELPSSLLAETPTAQELPENALLAENGLRTLIHQLADYDLKTAKCFEDLYDPRKAFFGSIQSLNNELTEINLLLHNDRLGKAHQQQEDKVCSTASELNQVILNLASAVASPITPTPYCDPLTVQRNVTYRMKEYLNMEKEYAIQCLTEQNVEKVLEENVFTIMQGIPLEHENIMSPLMDKCNGILGAVEEKTRHFHALTDWTAFESRFADEFAPEETTPIFITNENHPDEEQYTQFQRLRLDDLEIYHKIRPKKKRQVNRNLEAKLRWAKRMLTPARRGYACRGTWSLSSAGHLIEYDMKEHILISMFDLRKCKLGDLAPDETDTLGYFVLRGQKVYESSDRKRSKKKDYKFRAPLEKAKALHEVMSDFAEVAQIKEPMRGGQQEEGEELTRALSGDTVVNIDIQPSVE